MSPNRLFLIRREFSHRVLRRPVVNLITYLLVWTNPSVFTIYLNRVIGVAMNTFSGTTCSFACLSDLYEDPEDFAFAASALLDPLGVGLIAGPLVGLAAMRVTNGNFTLVFVAAALGSLWQLLNCFRFDETLAPENRKRFQLRFADINPLSFIKCFTCGRPTLAKLTLISGCYQVAHEGKNTADVHQAIMLRDVGMSEAARSNFVSLAGVGLMINCRSNKFLLNKLSGRLFTSATNLFSLVTMREYSNGCHLPSIYLSFNTVADATVAANSLVQLDAALLPAGRLADVRRLVRRMHRLEPIRLGARPGGQACGGSGDRQR